MTTLPVWLLVLATGAVCTALQPGDKKPESGPPSKGEAEKKGEASLKVGDKVPGLSIDVWVKGEEVKELEQGKVYIVEFWATWNPACVTSIPHLTRAQKDHADLTVIGIASSERTQADQNGKPVDARLAGVKSFVEKQGRNMGYRVAFEADRQMADAWMKTAGQKQLPCAFVVGHDGRLAYVGDPLKMDAALSKTLKAAADSKKAPRNTAE